MADDTLILQTLGEMRKEQTEQGKLLAAMAQHAKDSDTRLFGANGQQGILQYLATSVKQNTDDITVLKTSTSVKKAYVAGVAFGGGFVGSLGIKLITYIKTGHF